MEKFDHIIIGFGKGGKTLAGYLGGKGRKVALIEQSEKMYGGTCINVGCIPTKSLVHNAHNAQVHGFVSFEEKAAFYKQAMGEKKKLVEALRAKNYAKLAQNENITIYDGQASFLSDHVIRIEGRDSTRDIIGDRIYINTGSESILPPVEGLTESTRTYVSGTILDLEELPEHLIIIGGGYIGMEFASYFSSFGSRVTVLIRDREFLPKEDGDIAGEVRKVLGERVNFELGTGIHKIEDDGDGVTVFYTQDGAEKSVRGNAVLAATGRKPNTAALHLERAGVETTSRGAVKTDKECRTNVPHIYAMGDVRGGLQFTYVSLDDYRKVRASLEGRSWPDRDNTVPYSVFIDPPLSRVGMTEKQAAEAGLHFKVAKMAAAGVPKANVLQNPRGILKVIVDADSGLILGAALFCEESHEIINILKIAMDNRLPYTVLRDNVYTHPTMGEAFNDLLDQL